ncbi:MAG: ThiF family adenylyltransferase [Chloroflexota bacterium]|nr:ThiF family adenylyltransferase [Chloroflexota bacterium]
MYPDDFLAAFAKQEGFHIETHLDLIRLVGVPCLLAGGKVGSCTIEKSVDPNNGKPNSVIGGSIHVVRITIDREGDGRVYYSDGTPVENYVGGDGKTWSFISILRSPHPGQEDDETARELIHRYAKRVVAAVAEAKRSEVAEITESGPFNIPNTFESRAAIRPIQDRIRGQRIAVIGLGGTGSYILDLIAKTPVGEIHLFDADNADWHNLMRAPGAPTGEEIERLRSTSVDKVEYYHGKYDPLRRGVIPHATRIDGPESLDVLLEGHHIDFAFVSIDQQTHGNLARQDAVYRTLSEAEIPFVDSGVSITLQDDMVVGAVSTSFYEPGSTLWENTIPNARIVGGQPGYHNVQLPEVNALAASLAVMEWRRRSGQYDSKSTTFFHKFRLETPIILQANVQ